MMVMFYILLQNTELEIYFADTLQKTGSHMLLTSKEEHRLPKQEHAAF